MRSVQFVTYEDDGTDQIVSFAIDHGWMDVRSLILLRTPKYEMLLDDAERGVSVSMMDGTSDDGELLTSVKLKAGRVTIATRNSKYDLDISRVDPDEVAEMKVLLQRMNFDNRFRIEDN